MIIAETASTGRSGQEVAAFFHRMEKKKVAFTEWENALVSETAKQFPHWNTLALNGNQEIAAAVVGGEALGYGSISHMAVTPAHRRDGVGSKLVSRTVTEALRRTSAARIHLIVAEGNEEAVPFWAKHGFEISSEPAVELTVSNETNLLSRHELVEELDVQTVRTLFRTDPILRERLGERERDAITAELNRGIARAWSVVHCRTPTTVMFSASLGVRGVIRLFALQEELDRAACAAMLTSGIAHIASLGVLRLHSFPKTEWERTVLHDAGFQVQPGETTMIRSVN